MSMSMSFEEMRELLKTRLKPSRFEHSLGVSDTAVKLAERFGVNTEKARTAGLLHDCAREFPNGSLPEEARRRGIPIHPVEEAMPLLLHAPIGAFRISELYGVEDPEISQAIRCHTVGGAGMTDLDKIVYFADMIEPHRDYPSVKRLRKLALEASLDEMMLAGLTGSISFVLAKGHLIHPDTVTARNELILKKQEATKS